jgi:hypothetical protein
LRRLRPEAYCADAGAPGARRDAEAEGGDPRVSTTLARGLRILGAFRGSDGGPISNKEIAARSGLPKATVSRLIYTLVALGFVSQDKRSGGFLLAAGVLAPAYAFLANLDVRPRSRRCWPRGWCRWARSAAACRSRAPRWATPTSPACAPTRAPR